MSVFKEKKLLITGGTGSFGIQLQQYENSEFGGD